MQDLQQQMAEAKRASRHTEEEVRRPGSKLMQHDLEVHILRVAPALASGHMESVKIHNLHDNGFCVLCQMSKLLDGVTGEIAGCDEAMRMKREQMDAQDTSKAGLLQAVRSVVALSET